MQDWNSSMKITGILLCASLWCAPSVLASPIIYSADDVTKRGVPHNLKFNGGSFLTGSESGILTVDEMAGTVHYQDRVQNVTGTGGYDLVLNLSIVPLSTLTGPPNNFSSAPRCAGGDCTGAYYTDNGINPQTDWLFLLQDDTKTNTFTQWGTLGNQVFNVSTKWGQFGDGGGGIHVLPDGLAMGVWFDGGGDLNVDLILQDDTTGGQTTGGEVPEPASVLLLGSGIAALAGWHRKRQKQA